MGWEEVRDRHGYLNRIEVWGDPSHGELVLRPREMVYASGEGAEPARWPLGSIAAVQASSSALQVKGKRLPLVELSFENDSIYLWERLLHVALRDFYGRTGRGEIAEFQPRIVTA